MRKIIVGLLALTSVSAFAETYTYDVSYSCFLSEIQFNDGRYITSISNIDGTDFKDRLVRQGSFGPLHEDWFSITKDIELQRSYNEPKIKVNILINYFSRLHDYPDVTLSYDEGNNIITSKSTFSTGQSDYDTFSKGVGFSVIKKNIGGFRVVCSVRNVSFINLP